MALDDDIRVLSRVGLFNELADEHLRLLAFGAENIQFREGRDIYRQDTLADCAYVIASGDVDLYRTMGKERQLLRTVGAGALLGELALIAPTRRKTGAMARTDVLAIRLNQSLFRRILTEYPEVAAKIHSRLTGQFTDMVNDLAKLKPRFE